MLTLLLQALSDAEWHDEAGRYSSESRWLWCDPSPVVLVTVIPYTSTYLFTYLPTTYPPHSLPTHLLTTLDWLD